MSPQHFWFMAAFTIIVLVNAAWSTEPVIDPRNDFVLQFHVMDDFTGGLHIGAFQFDRNNVDGPEVVEIHTCDHLSTAAGTPWIATSKFFESTLGDVQIVVKDSDDKHSILTLQMGADYNSVDFCAIMPNIDLSTITSTIKFATQIEGMYLFATQDDELYGSTLEPSSGHWNTPTLMDVYPMVGLGRMSDHLAYFANVSQSEEDCSLMSIDKDGNVEEWFDCGSHWLTRVHFPSVLDPSDFMILSLNPQSQNTAYVSHWKGNYFADHPINCPSDRATDISNSGTGIAFVWCVAPYLMFDTDPDPQVHADILELEMNVNAMEMGITGLPWHAVFSNPVVTIDPLNHQPTQMNVTLADWAEDESSMLCEGEWVVDITGLDGKLDGEEKTVSLEESPFVIADHLSAADASSFRVRKRCDTHNVVTYHTIVEREYLVEQCPVGWICSGCSHGVMCPDGRCLTQAPFTCGNDCGMLNKCNTGECAATCSQPPYTLSFSALETAVDVSTDNEWVLKDAETDDVRFIMRTGPGFFNDSDAGGVYLEIWAEYFEEFESLFLPGGDPDALMRLASPVASIVLNGMVNDTVPLEEPVEICLYAAIHPDQSAYYCLAYHVPGDSEWTCASTPLRRDSENVWCTTVDHFTRFGILLTAIPPPLAESGNGQPSEGVSENAEFTETTEFYIIIGVVIGAVVLAVVIVILVVTIPKCRRTVTPYRDTYSSNAVATPRRHSSDESVDLDDA